MPLISTSQPNLISGVSQQADSLRLPSQASEQRNSYNSLVDGLIPRFHTDYVAKIISGTVGPAKGHVINRDTTERYQCVFRNNDLRIFDVNTGVEKTIAFPNGKAYITSTDPKNELVALSIADYTWILNKTKVVAMGTSVTPLYNNRAMVWVKQGAFDVAFTAKIENVEFTFSTGSSNTEARSDYAATGLYNLLINGSTGLNATSVGGHNAWNVQNIGSTILINRGDNLSFNISVKDSRSNTALGLVKDTVENFTDLPKYSIANQKVKILGLPDAPGDEYYCIFKPVAGVTATTVANLSVATLRASAVATVGTFDTSSAFASAFVGLTVKLIPISGGSSHNPSGSNVLGTVNAVSGGIPVISGITITNGQSGYAVGQLFRIERDTNTTFYGNVSCATISTGSKGRINTVTITSGGAGYAAGTYSLQKTSNATFFTTVSITVNGSGVITSVTTSNSGSFEFQVGDSLSFVAGAEQGTWVETTGFGMQYQLDNSTMPHILVREADGSFTFKRATWSDRKVGDANTNGDPSFVGNVIHNLSLFRDRLTFLSDENTATSEVDKFFNFFRTTVTQLLDSDPIDVAASSTKVNILYNSVPFYERLILFGDQTQFALQSADLLTPKSASIQQTTEYATIRTCAPISSGKNIYFGFARGTYSGLMEYYVPVNSTFFEALDVTAEVSRYLKGNLTKLTTTENEQVLCALTDQNPNGVYVYKYFFEGQKKLQSAWSRWSFGVDSKIEDIEFLDTTLLLLITRPEGLFIEKLSVEAGQVDINAEYVVRLDRRVSDLTSGVTSTYSATTDRTTWTIPYNKDSGRNLAVVTRHTSPAVGQPGGVQLTTVSQGTNTVAVKGNWTTQAVWIGELYTSDTDLPRPFLRTTNTTSGSTRVVSTGRTQVRRGFITYAKSKYFKVIVTVKGRDPFTYTFTGKSVGQDNATLGAETLEDGIFTFPVMSLAENVSIKLVNDSPFPSSLITVDFETWYETRNRRVN